MPAIRIVTWNVLYRDLAAREALVLAELERVAADVVLLQETHRAHAERLADALGMASVVCPDGAGRDVVPAVLTRAPALATAVVDLVDVGTPRRQHAAMATIPLADASLRVVSVHLRHTREAWRMAHGGALAAGQETRETIDDRLRQLDGLAAERSRWAAVDHEVVGGDMNFVPGGAEHAAMLAWGLIDAAAERREPTVLAANPLIGDTPADPALQRDYTLDFQLHDPSLHVVEHRVIGLPGADDASGAGGWPSDHLGVVVDYRA